MAGTLSYRVNQERGRIDLIETDALGRTRLVQTYADPKGSDLSDLAGANGQPSVPVLPFGPQMTAQVAGLRAGNPAALAFAQEEATNLGTAHGNAMNEAAAAPAAPASAAGQVGGQRAVMTDPSVVNATTRGINAAFTGQEAADELNAREQRLVADIQAHGHDPALYLSMARQTGLGGGSARPISSVGGSSLADPEMMNAQTDLAATALRGAEIARGEALTRAEQAWAAAKAGSEWAGQNQEVYAGAQQAERALQQAEIDAMNGDPDSGPPNPRNFERATRAARQNAEAARTAVHRWEQRYSPTAAALSDQRATLNAQFGDPGVAGSAPPTAATPGYGDRTVAPRYLVGPDGALFDNPNDGQDPRERLAHGELTPAGRLTAYAGGGAVGMGPLDGLPVRGRRQPWGVLDPSDPDYLKNFDAYRLAMNGPLLAYEGGGAVASKRARPVDMNGAPLEADLDASMFDPSTWWRAERLDPRGMPAGFGRGNVPMVYSGQAFRMADGGEMPELEAPAQHPTRRRLLLLPRAAEGLGSVNWDMNPNPNPKPGSRRARPATGAPQTLITGTNPASVDTPTYAMPEPFHPRRGVEAGVSGFYLTNPDGSVHSFVPDVMVSPPPVLTPADAAPATVEAPAAPRSRAERWAAAGYGDVAAEDARTAAQYGKSYGASSAWRDYLTTPAGQVVANAQGRPGNIPAWADDAQETERRLGIPAAATGARVALSPRDVEVLDDAPTRPNVLTGEGKLPDGGYRRELEVHPLAIKLGLVRVTEGPTVQRATPGTLVIPVDELGQDEAAQLPRVEGEPAEQLDDDSEAYRAGGRIYATRPAGRGRGRGRRPRRYVLPRAASGLGYPGVSPYDATGPAANSGPGLSGPVLSGAGAGYGVGWNPGPMPPLTAFQSYTAPAAYQAVYPGLDEPPASSLFSLRERLAAQGFDDNGVLPLAGNDPYGGTAGRARPGGNLNNVAQLSKQQRAVYDLELKANGMRGGLDDYLQLAQRSSPGSLALQAYA